MGERATATVETNPFYAEQVRRFRLARQEWASKSAIRKAAGVLGMTEREYAERYCAHLGPITYYANSANAPWPVWTHDKAWEMAAPDRSDASRIEEGPG